MAISMKMKSAAALLAALLAVSPLSAGDTDAVALTPMEKLGKNLFFDRISSPGCDR